ncbi:MAG: Ig-like domain-containing protein [Bacteroidota bacterium]
MFKRPSSLHVLISTVALFFGLLVYLCDRQPEHVYFLSHGLVPAHGPHPLFGVVGNFLPTFVHVYVFILLTAAVAGSTRARLIRICAAWFVIASVFEVAQHPEISSIIAAVVPAWFARIPVLDNTAAYFRDGTFDVLDLLSIALGTVAAYLTVMLTRNGADARALSGSPRRAARYLALGGITALGMLSIIGSGGGSSTPDTTPPTVSVTNPADGATGVFVDGSISITFSETMDPATVNPATFMLEDANHTPVLTSVNYAGNIVTFTPINPQPLAHSTVYTATITTGAKDLAGNAIAADHSWSFTTETDAWQATATSGAPTGRIKHTAVWTGNGMIVWGGQGSGGVTNTGGLYDPIADTWSATATSGAPAARLAHTAVWTGTEMIVWGGWNGVSTYFNDGAAYDPITGWSAIATPNSLVGRWDHTAVWTGTEMIVWGGNTNLGPGNDGAAYNPMTNRWRPIADPPAGFLGRANHTAVWTGSAMIVWGGNTNSGVVNTGAAYDPAVNTWRLISTTDAPAPRLDHTAIWTGPAGISMVIWGGDDFFTSFNDGARYDPVTDRWSATDLTINEVPTGRFDHSAVWTGSEMIVWGGNDGTFANTGGRYTP